VTSAFGALAETIGDAGICVPGDPRGPAYQQAFVDACVALLTDDGRWQEMSARALARTWPDYTWPSIAEGWEAICRTALGDEPPVIARIATHLAAGRTGLAHRMLDREAPPQGMADTWEALRAFITAREGHAEPLPPEGLRRLALQFPSLRRNRLLDAADAPATASSAA
jgi:hypothetical protein